MAELRPEQGQVNARIVYWGPEGSGKTSNLRVIRAKLRPDHRGELKSVPTRLDPTVSYETLPIELGEIAGLRTRIDVSTVPGGPEHAPTRKQLLDEVDGIVLVIDSQPHRIDENIAAFEELRQMLASYGRNLDDLPIVVQYNKRDLSDSFTMEELHRKLELRGAAAFEAEARRGTGVLQSLTTISKRVIRVLRDRGFEPPPEPAAPPAAAPRRVEAIPEAQVYEPPPAPRGRPAAAVNPRSAAVEEALRRESDHPEAREIAQTAERARSVLDTSVAEVTGQLEPEHGAIPSLDELTIESVGRATRIDERSVRVPLKLSDPAGHPVHLALTVRLDPLSGEGDD